MNEKFDCPNCGQDLRLDPDAIERIAALEVEVERLREWVLGSGRHSPICFSVTNKCVCGLDDLRAALAKKQSE